jgi:hypothetical protein
LPSNDGGIHTQPHRENRLTIEKLLEAVFFLPSGPKFTVMLCHAAFMTVVCSQSQRGKTREFEDLITEPLSSNGLLRGALLTALFWLSDVMSHVTYMFIWSLVAPLFLLSEIARGHTDKQTARSSHKPLSFFKLTKFG